MLLFQTHRADDAQIARATAPQGPMAPACIALRARRNALLQFVETGAVITRCRAAATPETVLAWATPPSANRSTAAAEGSGYRRSVSVAPPQYTSRMERSTKMRRVTVPDLPWTAPAGAVTRGACSFLMPPANRGAGWRSGSDQAGSSSCLVAVLIVSPLTAESSR